MADNKKPDKNPAGTESYVDLLKKRIAEKTGGNIVKRPPVQPKDDEYKPKPIKKEEQKVVEPAPHDVEWKENIKSDNRSARTHKDKNAEQPTKKGTSVLKRIGIITLAIVLTLVLVVGAYFAYLQFTFSRIEDVKYLKINNNQSNRVSVAREYSISTFNIGFGAYSQNYSFFMDEGQMANGTKTKGKSARAISEEDVKNNMNGVVGLINSSANSDFYFFQEVDTDSTRSYYVNQVDILTEAIPGFASAYAVNSHSKYLFYPLSEPIGKINSGIMTFSKFNMDHSIRRRLPISTGMIDKLFDLDRCFMVTKLPISGVNNKDLVLINVHLSAYDEGNIRLEQIKLLYDYINYEYNTNKNYVIVGGDFNLGLAGDAGIFNNEMVTPEWYKPLPEGYTAEDFKNIGFNLNYDISTTIGTCRDASIRYTEGVNLEVVIDGFITSANISVVGTEVIDAEFKNSDHNPVRMKFILN